MSAFEKAIDAAFSSATSISKPSGQLYYSSRDGGQNVDITAHRWTLGERVTEAEQDEHIITEVVMQDFLMDPAIFALAELSVLEPVRGDHLQLVKNGVIETYEIMSILPDPGTRYSERYSSFWRIHTKLIGEEPA